MYNLDIPLTLILLLVIIILFVKNEERGKTIKALGSKLNVVDRCYVSKLSLEQFQIHIERTAKMMLFKVLDEDTIHYSTGAESIKSKYTSIHVNLLIRMQKHFDEVSDVINLIYGESFLESQVDFFMDLIIADKSQYGLEAILDTYANKNK
jgi:hypothetical protein